ncbi:MAG: hypothetical protein WA324_14725 [Bryobacteraceae bacterium]
MTPVAAHAGRSEALTDEIVRCGMSPRHETGGLVLSTRHLVRTAFANKTAWHEAAGVATCEGAQHRAVATAKNAASSQVVSLDFTYSEYATTEAGPPAIKP